MQLIHYLNRPEYIFRPLQIYRRMLRSRRIQNRESPPPNLDNYKTVLLPWGVTIKIYANFTEVVGRALWAIGIYDLIVTEFLWRLIDNGETAIDVGANIGYMTSIMAVRVGETGKVWCFEPNPEVYEELVENVTNWQKKLGWQQIKTEKVALSSQSGDGVLNVPLRNRGEASVVSSQALENSDEFKTYTVSLAQLDDYFNNSDRIGVMKIDVEGHEIEVLKGAIQLMANQQIRDIIFEDHNGYPSAVSEFLEEQGYTVFRLWKGFWKPCLESPTKKHIHPWEPPNYLATKEPLRAIERSQKFGWSSMHSTK